MVWPLEGNPDEPRLLYGGQRADYVVPPEPFVPFPGFWEIAVGPGLLTGHFMRLTILFFLMQTAGTFLVLDVKSDVAFQGANLRLIGTEGEFVVRNLVLTSGALVVGSTIRRHERRVDGSEKGHGR